jgi:uncharacterized protein (TIGR03000 family)
MMNRLRFALVAAVALVLPLLAAEQSYAQWRLGLGGWRGGYYSGWGYNRPWYDGFYGYTNPWYGNYYSYYPYSSNYTYPYSSYYTYSYPYSYYSYPYTYSYYPYYGSTYYAPTVYSTTPLTNSITYASNTNPSGAYSTTQSFYPPNSQGNIAAMVEVQVPADAQLWFDGENTSQTGTDRMFRSPPLEPGQNYSYEVKAHWTDNGKDIERTRTVRVHAGERVMVNFMANEEGVGAPTRSGQEGTGTTTPRPGSGSEGTGTSPRPASGPEGTKTPLRPGSGS